jgi:hypothetical protein
MYSKSGGIAGAHSEVPTCDSIGSLSYLVVQVYQHSFRRQFRLIHRGHETLGTFHFAHLPSNFILAVIPIKDALIKGFRDHVEIGVHAQKLFDHLFTEKEGLATAIASLDTVRRRGKSNINIVELDEDAEDVD